MKLTLSALVDGKNINAGGHKLGLGLELEAWGSALLWLIGRIGIWAESKRSCVARQQQMF